MSDSELSPKSPAMRAVEASPTPFGQGNFSFHEDDGSPLLGLVSPLQIEKQPTAADLMDDQNLILDPATPRTRKHQLAERQMTTGPAAQVLKRHMDAVVKVYCVHSKPNFELPWQVRQQTTSKSTGFAVLDADGKRCILTNAHSVTYSSQVQLKKRGDDERYPAKVLAVGTECDVALLAVEDEEFWKGIMPLALSNDLPELQESVAVAGFPIGGDSLAISAGVVSRVQMTHYSHGCMTLLAVQTDSAINSGNSGGPVLNAVGHCVGIAFQSLTGDAQSIGYVVPTSVVRHFLEDVGRNGRYTGFPSLNISWQELESKALKKAYGMKPHEKGILVREVVEASREAGCLQQDDILLRIGGVEVGSDGTVPFRHGERVDFKYLVTNKYVGEEVELELYRGGEKITTSVKLQSFQHLVPSHNSEQKPSFFVVGGLVFTACSDPYLIQRYGSLANAPVRLVAKSYYGTKRHEEQQVVVLSNILACPATVGYDSATGLRDSEVISFNGEEIHSLVQLAKLVTACRDKFMRFDMAAAQRVVIMERTSAIECTAEVVEQHNMSASMSKDIKKALEVAEE